MLRRQSHARRPGSGSTLGRLGPALGWGAALFALVGLAFIVGRPGDERGGASASPSATAPAAAVLEFGTSLDEATRRVLSPQQAFQPGDTFAYSAELPQPPAAGEVLVQVVRIAASGEEEVQARTPQALAPGSRSLAVELPADRLYQAWGAGDYVMRVYDAVDGPIVAEGSFSLLDGS
jgi:hypothetical protein